MDKRECNCNDTPYFPAKVRATVDGFERIISFKSGYVCPGQGGSSHGRHGMDLIFVFTGWCPDWDRFMSPAQFEKQLGVMPADIGYHSPTPMYKNQLDVGNCLWTGSAHCYSDGSALNAADALWQHLADYYRATFKEAQ